MFLTRRISRWGYGNGAIDTLYPLLTSDDTRLPGKEMPNIRQHCMEKLSNAGIAPVNMHGRNVDLLHGEVVYILGLLWCSSDVGFLNEFHLTRPPTLARHPALFCYKTGFLRWKFIKFIQCSRGPFIAPCKLGKTRRLCEIALKIFNEGGSYIWGSLDCKHSW